MSDLEWTTTPPTEQGYYWARFVISGDIILAQLEKDIDRVRAYIIGEDAGYWLDNFTHFIGPLSLAAPEPPNV
jgi:hypothetical protein